MGVYQYVPKKFKTKHEDDDGDIFTIIELPHQILVGWLTLSRSKARWLSGRLMKFVNRERKSKGE